MNPMEQHYHRKLAEHFERKIRDDQDWSSQKRELDELPWQLYQAGEWEKLADWLADKELLKALWASDSYAVRKYWQAIEANSKPQIRMEDKYQFVFDELGKPVIGFRDLLKPLEEQLQKRLASSQSDSAFLVILMQLFMAAGYVDKATSLNDYLAHHFQIGPSKTLSEAIKLNEEGNAHLAKGYIDRAMDSYNQALALAESRGEQTLLSIIYSNLARGYKQQEQYDQALKWSQKAVMIERMQRLERSLAITLNNQGNIYLEMGDYEAAEACFDEAEDISSRLNDLENMQRIFGNRAVLWLKHGEPEQAVVCLNRKLSICESIGYWAGMAQAYYELARIDIDANRLDEALSALESMISVCQKADDKRNESLAWGERGELLMEQGNLDEALKHFKREEALGRDLGDPKIVERSQIMKQRVKMRRR